MAGTTRSESRRLAFGIVAAGFLAALPLGPALAGCTDPAVPGVNWQRCYFDERDFRGADLTGATLRDGRFARADLSGATLVRADARRAKFFTATLVNVDFTAARLAEADFTKADLTGAVFRQADLRRARLFRAVLRNADFTEARMRDADLLDADLSGARWVDGKTICAEGSIGQCNAVPKARGQEQETSPES